MSPASPAFSCRISEIELKNLGKRVRSAQKTWLTPKYKTEDDFKLNFYFFKLNKCAELMVIALILTPF